MPRESSPRRKQLVTIPYGNNLLPYGIPHAELSAAHPVLYCTIVSIKRNEPMDCEKTAAIGLFHRDAPADQVSKSLKHHVNN